MMRNAQIIIMNKLRHAWRHLRTLTGDDAYERYMLHHTCAHSPCTPLSRRAYFHKAQRRQWDKINRCC